MSRHIHIGDAISWRKGDLVFIKSQTRSGPGGRRGYEIKTIEEDRGRAWLVPLGSGVPGYVDLSDLEKAR